VATAAAIRDRVQLTIEALTPTRDPQVRFRGFRNEASFAEWATSNAAGCQRRFEVRTDGKVPAVFASSTAGDDRHVLITVRVAYPATGRAGAGMGMDRDDMLDADYFTISQGIGYAALAAFATVPCTPLGCAKDIERTGIVDYLVVSQTFRYQRGL
jgi:hypothetical protein